MKPDAKLTAIGRTNSSEFRAKNRAERIGISGVGVWTAVHPSKGARVAKTEGPQEFDGHGIMQCAASSAVIRWRGLTCNLAADAPGSRSCRWVHWIRSTLAGNQARAAAKRYIFESPLNENDHAALKLDNVNQMYE